MSFDSLEISEESSRPVELFVFTVGTTVYRYTSSESDETINSNVYTAEAITRGSSSEGPSKRDVAFEIDVPSSNDVAKLFVGIIPGSRMSIDVFRYQRDDTPTPTLSKVFAGFVSRVNFIENGNVAKITSTPAIASLSRAMPRYGYQQQCNHVLYDAQCQVDSTLPAFRSQNETVLSMTGHTMIVTGALAFADGWFDAGRVSLPDDSDHRMILSHIGSTLILSQPFVSTPLLVTLYAGCPHTAAPCQSKFNNVINFGGFPFIPTRDPYTEGVL